MFPLLFKTFTLQNIILHVPTLWIGYYSSDLKWRNQAWCTGWSLWSLQVCFLHLKACSGMSHDVMYLGSGFLWLEDPVHEMIRNTSWMRFPKSDFVTVCILSFTTVHILKRSSLKETENYIYKSNSLRFDSTKRFSDSFGRDIIS